jgi:hypothetical protein
MRTAIMNPLDAFDNLIDEAILDTYSGLCSLRPPTLSEVAEYFPAHFYQALYLQVMTREMFSSIGIETESELIEHITDDVYRQFMPPVTMLSVYLNRYRLSFMDWYHPETPFQNYAITEVW